MFTKRRRDQVPDRMVPLKLFENFTEDIDEECCSFRNDEPYIFYFFDENGVLLQSYLSADMLTIQVEGRSVFETLVAYLCSFLVFNLKEEMELSASKYFVPFMQQIVLAKPCEKPLSGAQITWLTRLQEASVDTDK